VPRESLEQRMEALERQVATLLASPEGKEPAKDWRRTRGVFTDDDLMKQVFAEGRKIREAESKHARSRTGKKPQTKS
jgi:hypothetical protein